MNNTHDIKSSSQKPDNIYIKEFRFSYDYLIKIDNISI